MSFSIIRNDITKVKADVIVNTANPKARVGRGTDFAIYQAAGKEQLLAARKVIGEIAPGQAEYTDAFNLNARYIIHTVGPEWIDGNHGERDVLHSCYEKSLLLAEKLSCKSIAFPLIAAGVYGFPKDEALSIALAEISKFLLTHEMKVILVVFDRKALELSETLVGEIEQFIDDHSTHQIREQEYGSSGYLNRRRRESNGWIDAEPHHFFVGSAPAEPLTVAETDSAVDYAAALPAMAGKTLDEVLEGAGSSFQKKLFELIDARGMTDVDVYKRANIDRKVFSSIRCKADYKPKKKTAIALAIALELDMPTMVDLLSRAEIAFSPNSKFDLIITYFVENKNYDIFAINAALFRYGLPTLGD